MRIIYQIGTLLLIIGCSVEIPNEQQQFIDEWKKIKNGYNNANTSSSKQKFKDKGYTFLKENKSKVNNWYGKVIDITSNNRIVVKHKGIEFTLKQRGEYAPSLNKLKKGDKILFSGNLDGESSFTTAGAIDRPEMVAIIDKLTNTKSSENFYEYVPSPKELSDKWWSFSKNKLTDMLTKIMTQKDNKGEYLYDKYPTYNWTEPTGYTTSSGKLIYKRYGEGTAEMYNSMAGSVSENGSWKIQWAPATNSSPFDSDIIFTIKYQYGKFSHHIGSDNTLWTPIEKFCNKHFSDKDAKKMMAFGDSLRNAFIKENNLIIGNDGRFKFK